MKTLEQASLQRETIQVRCEDGVALGGLLLLPEQPRAVIQFNNGTGARKEFYLPFLQFLASEGFVCCLWDYRGSGDSAPESLKGCTYTFSDYGCKDIPAVKSYLRTRFPELPFLFIGHSAGGQQIGFTEDLSDVQGMLAFAVSVGYAPYMPWRYRLATNYFFHLFSPISIALSGYLDAKRFGVMEDLPKNVVREWRAWCAKSSYLFDPAFYGKTIPKGNFKNYDFPIEVYWASDDPISNATSIPAYWKHIQNAQAINFTEVKPTHYGLKGIGHFGFFKKSLRESLWQEVLQKLNELLR